MVSAPPFVPRMLVGRAASRFVYQNSIIPSRRRFHNCILIAERDHDSGGSFQICYVALSGCRRAEALGWNYKARHPKGTRRADSGHAGGLCTVEGRFHGHPSAVGLKPSAGITKPACAG